MSTKRRLAVSVGGLWLCSGRLDQKKIQKKILARLGWFSVADVRPGFLNFFFRLRQQRELRCRDLRDMRSPNPLSFLLPQHGNTPVWRLEEATPTPLARGSVAVGTHFEVRGRIPDCRVCQLPVLAADRPVVRKATWLFAQSTNRAQTPNLPQASSARPRAIGQLRAPMAGRDPPAASCSHGWPRPGALLGFGLCGRLPRHGVGGFLFV